MKENILGIDPGLNGGFILLSPEGELIRKDEVPKFDSKNIDLMAMRELFFTYSNTTKHVYMEKITAMPFNGRQGLFKFGKVCGQLEAFITAFQMPVTYVSPNKWMKKMHDGISKEIDSKKRSAIACKQLFPTLDMRRNEKCKKPHDGYLDGLLLAEYGRREVYGN